MSSGAFQFISSEELITTAAMTIAMAKAGKAVGKYKAPNAQGASFGRKSMFMGSKLVANWAKTLL